MPTFTSSPSPLDWLALLSLVLVGIVILSIEKKDVIAPQLSPPIKCLIPGKTDCYTPGWTYRVAIGTPTDSCSELQSKTQNAADLEAKSVKWRRSLLLSLILTIFFLTLIVGPASFISNGREEKASSPKLGSNEIRWGWFPTWPTTLTTVLLFYLPIYMINSYYSMHVSDKTSDIIENNLQLMKTACNSNQPTQ